MNYIDILLDPICWKLLEFVIVNYYLLMNGQRTINSHEQQPSCAEARAEIYGSPTRFMSQVHAAVGLGVGGYAKLMVDEVGI